MLLTVTCRHGEVSRAMRNRGIELFILADIDESPAPTAALAPKTPDSEMVDEDVAVQPSLEISVLGVQDTASEVDARLAIAGSHDCYTCTSSAGCNAAAQVSHTGCWTPLRKGIQAWCMFDTHVSRSTVSVLLLLGACGICSGMNKACWAWLE